MFMCSCIVTGANRGIGYGFVEKLAVNPNNVVFAGLRSTNLDKNHPLVRLASEKPNNVHLVALTSADKENNLAAAEIVKGKYGKIDVIIANAGTLPAPT
jgi:NAD(P)-dependent dehydrogenase (short-subunit alcohol dehydrogenase family)